MLKTLKWIYKLGALHERRRIKLLVAKHRDSKPERHKYMGSIHGEDQFVHDLELYNAVGRELQKLFDPTLTTHRVEMSAPIDVEGVR